jgi:hypothetical protein
LTGPSPSNPSFAPAVECASAVARAEHEGLLDATGAPAAFTRLDALRHVWREVEPTPDLRDVARRLLRSHLVRAADAIQLAGATLAAQHKPGSLVVVTLDVRLETAALREGFVVVRPVGGAVEP